MQVLADSLPGLLLYIDRSLVIQFVNAMAERWHAQGLGSAIDDMLGHHLETVLSQEQYKFVTPWIKRALNGETVEFVTPEGGLDSEPRFRNVIYAPHHADDGSVPGFFALVMDITDRRRAELKRDELERQLMEAQKMEAVGTLAGGIAHDFNNMLQVILGYSDMLLLQIQEQPLLAEQVTAIRSAARRSSELTHQLLAFSRRQSTAPRSMVDHELSAARPTVYHEHTGAETILLVEDEPLVLDLGKSLLQKLGYRVIVARSATEALRIAEQNVVHLLITDVIMPDMHGRDLADAIVSLQNHTRVLFMSGFANEVVQRKRFHESDIAFLQKPFSPGDLANRIREILAG